jgi:hypothetical protein
VADIPGTVRAAPTEAHQAYLAALQRGSAPHSSLPVIANVTLGNQSADALAKPQGTA